MNHYLLNYKNATYLLRAPSAFDAFYKFVWKRPVAISSYRITGYDAETGGKMRLEALANDLEVTVKKVCNP